MFFWSRLAASTRYEPTLPIVTKPGSSKKARIHLSFNTSAG
jgi:hypothetical protein